MKSLLTNHLSAPVVFFFLAAALCSFCTAESSTELAPIVQLKAGKVVGVVQTIKNGTGKVHKYEGIRYGLADRFAKPTAVPAWTNVYNATHSREKCPQMNLPSTNSTADIMLAMTQLTGENCLYLSIWRKADTTNTSSASADLKPVMVFIHGGTYLAGSIFVSGGGQFLADGGDVIAVAIQYRLGALGLLTGTGIPANLQLLDQIFALKWIQENIAAFGGNPKQVTIFGESSGSMNVGQLILSPLARGLFSQAIMQSGGPLAFFGADNQTVADRKRATFATAIGCPAEPKTSSVACLKQKPMADFINATLKMIVNNDFFVPVYGGNEVLPLSPAEALKVGAFNHLKAVIYGVNANEGSHIAVSSFPAVLSNNTKLTLELVRKELVKALKKFGVEYGEEVADYYLAELKHSANVSQDQLRVALANPLGDSILTCTTVLFGECLATAKKVAGDKNDTSTKFYSYRLEQHQVLPGLHYLPFEGVTHGEDVIYLFFANFLSRPVDKQLSDDMIAAWTAFARTGSPSALPSLSNGSKVQWTEAINQQYQLTRFMSLSREGAGFHMVGNDFYRKTCNAFWKAKFLK